MSCGLNPDLPPWLQVLYPFSPHKFISAEGLMHYVDAGQGEPIVFLHGNPTWSFFYRSIICDLSDRYRCLALDHLGCGLSDKPAAADYTLAGHIRRADAWLESLGIGSFQLVVHDWGGAIGFGLAAKRARQIQRIHILNTAAFRFRPMPWRIALCRVPLLGMLAIRGGNLFARKATQLTTVNPLPPAVRDGYLYPYPNWASRVAIQAFVQDIPMRRWHRSWRTMIDIENSLKQWRDRSVQIIWGMQDWCFHAGFLAEWQRRLPQAPVHRIEAAGHYLTEDAGPAISAAIGER